VIVIPVLVGRCFGVLNFARINGLIFGGAGIGAVIGIPLAGYIFDTTKSYEIVILACVIGCALSGVLALLIRPDRYRAEFITEELGSGLAG
jgi:MFS family permease